MVGVVLRNVEVVKDKEQAAPPTKAVVHESHAVHNLSHIVHDRCLSVLQHHLSWA